MSSKRCPWGVQAIFKDLYGNCFVLVQQAEEM